MSEKNLKEKYDSLMPNTVFRVVKDKQNPYVMINKIPIHNKELSFKARGILSYLMSLPNDWVLYISELEEHSEKDGKTSVENGVKELKKAGHIQHVAIRKGEGAKNKIEGKVHLVFELPSLNPFPTDQWGKTIHIAKDLLNRLLSGKTVWKDIDKKNKKGKYLKAENQVEGENTGEIENNLQPENLIEGVNTVKEGKVLQPENQVEGIRPPSIQVSFGKGFLTEANQPLLSNDNTDIYKDDLKTVFKDESENTGKVSIDNLDLSFLPDDYPTELRKVVTKCPELFPHVGTALDILERTRWAHGKAAKDLGYEIAYDYRLAAKTLKFVIVRLAQGNVEDLLGYYHKTLVQSLFEKGMDAERNEELGSNSEEFTLYNWLRGQQ